MAVVTFELVRHFGRGNNWVYQVGQADDGGYLVSFDSGDSVVQLAVGLLRTDSLGNVKWWKTYHSPTQRMVCGGSCVTRDGNYVVAGMFSGVGMGDGWAAKVDSVGDTIWTYVHAGPGSDDFRNVTATSDSGCVITGRLSEGRASGMGMLKLSRDGQRQWLRILRPPGMATEGLDACETRDRGIVAHGAIFADSSATPTFDYIVRMDSVGETLWTATYAPPRRDTYAVFHGSVCTTASRGYALCGTSVADSGLDANACFLTKFDSTGSCQWTRIMFDESLSISRTYLHCVTGTPDDGFVIVGERCEYQQGNQAYKLLLVRTDSLGDTLWTRQFDGLDPTVTDFGDWVITTRDHGFAAGGTAEAGAVYLIKTDSMGQVYNAMSERGPAPLQDAMLIAEPTPFRRVVNIRLGPGTGTVFLNGKPCQSPALSVYDAAGREVRKLPFRLSATWDGRDDGGHLLPAGAYFIEARTQYERRQVKVLLAR